MYESEVLKHGGESPWTAGGLGFESAMEGGMGGNEIIIFPIASEPVDIFLSFFLVIM